jgi:hypothetical protein
MKEIWKLMSCELLGVGKFGLLLLFGVKRREIGVESVSDFLKLK